MANQNTTQATNESVKKPTAAEDKASASKKEGEADEAAAETFPASDAPASWAGKDIAPQDRKDAQKKA